MDDKPLFDHQLARRPDYTDQLKNHNQYIITYKIDSNRSSTLLSFIYQKQCLLSIFYVCVLVCASLVSTIGASQTLPGGNSPNSAQNGPLHSQSPRTVATKYGIVRGTIITLPNVNLQQVEAFLGK